MLTPSTVKLRIEVANLKYTVTRGHMYDGGKPSSDPNSEPPYHGDVRLNKAYHGPPRGHGVNTNVLYSGARLYSERVFWAYGVPVPCHPRSQAESSIFCVKPTGASFTQCASFGDYLIWIPQLVLTCIAPPEPADFCESFTVTLYMDREPWISRARRQGG